MTQELLFKMKLIDGVKSYLSCYRVAKEYQQEIINIMLDNLDVFKTHLNNESKKNTEILKINK